METVEITMIVKASYANCDEGDESILALMLREAIRSAVDDGFLTEDTVADFLWLTAETFRGHDARYDAPNRIGSVFEIDLEEPE